MIDGDRTEPQDEWCREETCRYRHWRSGSMPTHKRGSDCPPVSQRDVEARLKADYERRFFGTGDGQMIGLLATLADKP